MRIVCSMTYRQRVVLRRLTCSFKTARQLNARANTLNALVRRGLAESRQLGNPEDGDLPREWRKAGCVDLDRKQG